MDVSKFTESVDRQSGVLCDNSMQFGDPFNGFLPVDLKIFRPDTDNFDSSCIPYAFRSVLCFCAAPVLSVCGFCIIGAPCSACGACFKSCSLDYGCSECAECGLIMTHNTCYWAKHTWCVDNIVKMCC